jgi:hypothetical protein
MKNEIIQIVAHDNDDGFSTLISYFHENSFHYFEDYLMVKLTLV